MKQKLVSILIVTYNAEEFIKKTLLSCIKQTYQNIEILILDNSSRDGTVKIIEEIKTSKVKLFEYSENIGPFKGLNLLIEKTKGEYVAIQDHDDIWYPDKIEKQVDFLEKNKDFIACGTLTYRFYEDKKLLLLSEKEFLAESVNHTSLMFRNLRFKYDTNYLLTDEHFEKKILRKEGKIACLQDPLTIHRIRKDKKNLSFIRFRASFKNIKHFFEINGFSLQATGYLIYLLINNILPEKLIWLVRKQITQKNSQWITLDDFKENYPTIEL